VCFYHGRNIKGLHMLFTKKLLQLKSHFTMKLAVSEVFFVSFNENSHGLEPLEGDFKV